LKQKSSSVSETADKIIDSELKEKESIIPEDVKNQLVLM
jgi:hypothetical protein